MQGRHRVKKHASPNPKHRDSGSLKIFFMVLIAGRYWEVEFGPQIWKSGTLFMLIWAKDYLRLSLTQVDRYAWSLVGPALTAQG